MVATVSQLVYRFMRKMLALEHVLERELTQNPTHSVDHTEGNESSYCLPFHPKPQNILS